MRDIGDLRDDEEITVKRPGRDDVKMPWSQWVDNADRYECAGFTWVARELPKIDKTKPATIIKAQQEACLDDDSPEEWDDARIIDELCEMYRTPEDFDGLSVNVEFNYKTWAMRFVRSIKGSSSLTGKQRESAIKLVLIAWRG